MNRTRSRPRFRSGGDAVAKDGPAIFVGLPVPASRQRSYNGNDKQREDQQPVHPAHDAGQVVQVQLSLGIGLERIRSAQVEDALPPADLFAGDLKQYQSAESVADSPHTIPALVQHHGYESAHERAAKQDCYLHELQQAILACLVAVEIRINAGRSILASQNVAAPSTIVTRYLDWRLFGMVEEEERGTSTVDISFPSVSLAEMILSGIPQTSYP